MGPGSQENLDDIVQLAGHEDDDAVVEAAS
jgi:hypothetical protein